MSGSQDVVVRVFRSVEECEPWREAINDLNRRAARPCPFSTFEFLRDYVANDEFHPNGVGQEFLFIALFEDKKLVGYAPMARRTESVLGYDCPRMGFLLTHDNDRPHLVCAKEDLARLAPVFVRYFMEQDRDWDFMEFWDQDAAGGLAGALSVCGTSSFYVRSFPGVPNSTLSIKWATLDAYYRSLRRKFRNNTARTLRRLFASGELSWTWADSSEGTQALMSHYKGIERRCWKSAVSGTIGRHPMREAFFDALATPGQPLELKTSIIAFDGLPIAGFMLGAFDKTLYGLQLAFDERYAELGPGLLAILLGVHKAIEGGYTALNLLHGSTHYKEKWLAETLPTHSLQLYRRASLPYVKAKLGAFKRVAEESLRSSDRADFNIQKRELMAEQGFVSNLDREPLRQAFRATLGHAKLTTYSAQQIATLLPFDVSGMGSRAERYRSARRSRSRAQNRKTGVAIFDADAPPALAFARSLGRGKVPVHVYDPRAVTVTGSSRYATATHRCPEPSEADRFLPWLARELERGNIGVIAPTSDVLTYYLAELHELLPEDARAIIPDKRTMLSLLFKDRFAAACNAAGVATPWTWCPNSLAEVRAQARELPYPLIIKPKSHVGVGLTRGAVVHNAQELIERFAAYDIPTSSRDIARQYPELAWPMLQEYVPGALQNLFSISGVLAPDGTALAYSASKKREQWPPALGVGTVFEGYDEARCLSIGIRAAQALLGKGMFELELIYDARSDRFLAIDLNPRAYGQIALDVARGNDLPLTWYRALSGETVLPKPPPTVTGQFIHSIPYHVGQWVGLTVGEERAKRWMNYRQVMATPGARVDIVNDKRDPVPSVVFAARMLRHPGGLVRPFLREVNQKLIAPAQPTFKRPSAPEVESASDEPAPQRTTSVSAPSSEAVMIMAKAPGGEG